ncbi:hypothetical protein BDZ89DRAFT_1072405 [Hymenopellis radicata]|nr:hypothetical protein BDZ89DRAFT_1072405 [Hymenopellis radicata]
MSTTNGLVEGAPTPTPTPPTVTQPYDRDNALDDIPAAGYALSTFYASQMVEAEAYIDENDPEKTRLYFASCYGLFQCIKSLMSFADEDILVALQRAKHGNYVASQYRKKGASLTTRLASYVVSSLSPTGVGFVKSMTPLERHAELIYAETLFEKAILGVMYSGDWLSLIKEVLNMRTTINIYRSLYNYITTLDEESPSGHDDTVDEHLRSGVYFGYGLSSLILSLLPSKVITIVHLFGYHGDRTEALDVLQRAGGWSKESDEPTVSGANEGVRRLLCDMMVVTFHTLLSSISFDGIDITMADKIVRWNSQRYPNSVFILWAQGRLLVVRSQPREALVYYNKSIAAQSQYPTLYAMSYWEMAIANLALWDVSESMASWRDLERESSWSKAIYTYGVAACLLQGSGPADDAAALLEKVPGLLQKIAGKSIPLEKLVSRRARKFMKEHRLVLPALEIGYIFLAITHAPREVLAKKMLPEIRSCLEGLKGREKLWGYHDDLCLSKFLEGVCLRYLAYPDVDAVLPPDLPSVEELTGMSEVECAKQAEVAFTTVFEHGTKIELDHHVVYYAHYEYGRFLSRHGQEDKAREQFELVLSGKHLEVGPSGKKGKYSLKDMVHVQTHAALEALGKRPL